MVEVERVGLRQAAQLELHEDSFRDLLEGGGAAHPGVVLGEQGELDVIAVGGVASLAGLGTSIGAPDHQADGRKPHDA